MLAFASAMVRAAGRSTPRSTGSWWRRRPSGRRKRWSSSSGPAVAWCCRWAAWRCRRSPSWTRTWAARLGSGNFCRCGSASSRRWRDQDLHLGPDRGMVNERHVVLIGGSGFIGQHLAARLTRHGWRVRVTSRQARQGSDADGRVEAVRADLRDEDQIKSAIGSAEAVVNLVGIARPWRQSFEAVHVEGAARIAHLAAVAGVERLVHLSALGIDEEAPAAA